MMLRGVYSMITMAYGHSFHNKCYDTFDMERLGEDRPTPKAALRAVPYNPSLVTAQNSRRYG